MNEILLYHQVRDGWSSSYAKWLT